MPPPLDGKGRRSQLVLYLLLLLYGVARVLQLSADRVPHLLIVMLHVVPPAVFAWIHGREVYRAQGIAVFTALSLGIGSFVELVSLRNGFPFGHYFFTDLMGPKVFGLPVLLALAYVGMGYVSWMVGVAILGYWNRPLTRGRVILLPLVASFVMVAWDLSMDPMWANIDRAWVWRDGGAYFGVPVSNFLGWFLTVYLFYQLFAVYLGGREVVEIPVGYSRLPVWFYGASAVGNVLFAVSVVEPKTVMDGAGHVWMVADIIAMCVLVSVFVMGAFAVMAWAGLANCKRALRSE